MVHIWQVKNQERDISGLLVSSNRPTPFGTYPTPIAHGTRSVTIVDVQTSNLIKTMLPAISQAGRNGPVLDPLKASVQPGGLVVYETFTTYQPRFGRPSNPNFLLRPGELEDTFSNWNILHSFEGVTHSESGGGNQAIAQIVARKPDS